MRAQTLASPIGPSGRGRDGPDTPVTDIHANRHGGAPPDAGAASAGGNATKEAPGRDAPPGPPDTRPRRPDRPARNC